MLLGSIALFLTIHICEGYLAMGIVSVWTSLGAFMASRAATAFYRFNSKGSKIPKQA
jgi:Na+-driven multidrug efflux pump